MHIRFNHLSDGQRYSHLNYLLSVIVIVILLSLSVELITWDSFFPYEKLPRHVQIYVACNILIRIPRLNLYLLVIWLQRAKYAFLIR